MRLIRTAHEIHYRWNQWRMNGNKLRWKCSCPSAVKRTSWHDRKQRWTLEVKNSSSPQASRGIISPVAQVQRVCKRELETRAQQVASSARSTFCIAPSEEKTNPATIWKTQLVLGSSQASNTGSIRGCGPLYCQYSFINYPFSPYRPLAIVRIPSRTPLHEGL